MTCVTLATLTAIIPLNALQKRGIFACEAAGKRHFGRRPQQAIRAERLHYDQCMMG